MKRLAAGWALGAAALLAFAAYRAGILGPGEPMKRLVFRKVTGPSEPSMTMTLYRIGSKYGRLEERAAPDGQVLQMIVVREPDIWQIDPKTHIGRHTRDTGPFFDFHSPIIPPEPGSAETLEAYRAKPLSSFEFGRELEFMRRNRAEKTGAEEVRGQACDRYELTMDGRVLVVLAKASTESVMEARVFKDQKKILAFAYDSYEPSLNADLSLFKPPQDVRMSEGGEETPSPKEQGPGPAVQDKKSERAALAAMAAFSAAKGRPGHPWKMVFCGPVLWKRLLALDAGLSRKGTSTAFMVRQGVRAAKIPVQRFLGAGAKIDDSGLYRSKGFQMLAQSFAAGRAHSASKAERAALYAVLPFEMTGRPVTVIAAGEDSLLYFEGGGLLWLDLATR